MSENICMLDASCVGAGIARPRRNVAPSPILITADTGIILLSAYHILPGGQCQPLRGMTTIIPIIHISADGHCPPLRGMTTIIPTTHLCGRAIPAPTGNTDDHPDNTHLCGRAMLAPAGKDAPSPILITADIFWQSGKADLCRAGGRRLISIFRQ